MATRKVLPPNLQSILIRGYDDPVLFIEELLGMPLHDGQKEFLRRKAEDLKAGRKIKIWLLVPANRWGKSILVACLHIWYCFYKIGIGRGNAEGWARAEYMTANLAPHSEATLPVFEAIRAILTSSFAIPQEDGTTKHNECKIGYFLNEKGIRTTAPMEIPFTNRSTVIFRSTGEDKGTSIQGKKLGYISYDEGGRSKHLEYELKSNIIPRLGDMNGTFDLISTPEQASPSLGYHKDLFDAGQNGWDTEDTDGNAYQVYSQSGSITENIFFLRGNPTYVADTLALYAGDPLVNQVLYGHFVLSGATLFDMEELQLARDKELNGGVAYEKGHTYIIAIDSAIGNDECVYTVLDTTVKPFKVVRQMAAKGTAKSPQVHIADLIALAESYMDTDELTGIKRTHNVKLILEAWNEGSARFYFDLPMYLQVITKIWGSWPGPVDKVDPTRFGRRTNPAKKADILIALRKLLAAKNIKIPDEPVLVKQLQTYREQDKDLTQDRVISLCLACWYATDGAPVRTVATVVEW